MSSQKTVQYQWEDLQKHHLFDEDFVRECFRKISMDYLHTLDSTIYTLKEEGEFFVIRNFYGEEVDSVKLPYFGFQVKVEEVGDELLLIGTRIKGLE